MHQPMEQGLESYLAGRPDESFLRHVEECVECREAVSMAQLHSEIIQTLRPPAESFEPTAGFYARVMDRIDSQREGSIWSVFLEPLFGRRLIYASAVLTLVLGISLFTSPREDQSMAEQILAEQSHPSVTAASYEQDDHMQQDRETVLVQLTTYQE
jgi:hypothetical protein